MSRVQQRQAEVVRDTDGGYAAPFLRPRKEPKAVRWLIVWKQYRKLSKPQQGKQIKIVLNTAGHWNDEMGSRRAQILLSAGQFVLPTQLKCPDPGQSAQTDLGVYVKLPLSHTPPPFLHFQKLNHKRRLTIFFHHDEVRS